MEGVRNLNYSLGKMRTIQIPPQKQSGPPLKAQVYKMLKHGACAETLDIRKIARLEPGSPRRRPRSACRAGSGGRTPASTRLISGNLKLPNPKDPKYLAIGCLGFPYPDS